MDARLSFWLSMMLAIGCAKPSTNADAGASSAASAPASVPASSDTTDASAPAWLSFTDRAPVLGEQARKTRLGVGARAAQLAAIDGLFETITRQPETAGGIREAARLLERHQDYGADRRWTGSGTSPGATLMHHGGMALLVDLTTRACAAQKGDEAVGKAADEVPLPPWFNSGGIDKTTAERDRHVLQEAARACGAKVEP
ncbi:MAG: hypothetical protein KF819_06950 [Labilithrix sp.]|nr:hypothetical protein [Labilithrix sp.]